MNSLAYVPFVASAVVAALSRLGSSRLWPRAATWAITVASTALALSMVGALVILASPLPAQLPLVAAAGRWQPGAVASHSPVPYWISAVALVTLVALTCRVVRQLRSLAGEVRDASRLSHVLRRAARDDVVVVDDEVPHAHAVGLGITGRGAIIVSASMLALLDDDEQVAVIAHERSHLRERHTLFFAAVRLATALNPLLDTMRADLQFALERSADESAAAETERAVVASALAKAALAVLDRAPSVAGFAFHPHGLTDRVAAMLDAPNRRSRPAWVLVAIAAGGALALAWAAHDTERFFEAVRLWSSR